jgi:hypothetical protein
VTQTFAFDADEHIYGVGLIENGKMNQRGENRRMMQSNLEDFQNIFHSQKGYAVFWDNYSPTQLTDRPNDGGMTLSSEVGELLDYYFIYGETADGVVALIRELTGDVPMIPLYAYGYWQSRERYKSSRELTEVVDKYRQLGYNSKTYEYPFRKRSVVIPDSFKKRSYDLLNTHTVLPPFASCRIGKYPEHHPVKFIHIYRFCDKVQKHCSKNHNFLEFFMN